MAAFVSSAPALAEGTLLEPDFLSESPIALSASRLAQPLSRASAAVTVISRETR